MLLNSILSILTISLCYYSYHHSCIFHVNLIDQNFQNIFMINYENHDGSRYDTNFSRNNFIESNKMLHIASNNYKRIRDIIFVDDGNGCNFITVRYNSLIEYFWLLFLLWFINNCIFIENLLLTKSGKK